MQEILNIVTFVGCLSWNDSLLKIIEVSALRCTFHASEHGFEQGSALYSDGIRSRSKGIACNFPTVKVYSCENNEKSTSSHTCDGSVLTILLISPDNPHEGRCLPLGRDFVDECTLDDCRKCSDVNIHYHCTSCPTWKHFPSLFCITCHIQQTHMNPCRTFDYGGFHLLPCKRDHVNFQFRHCRYQYQCP